jgi:proline iminopeptidase
LISRAEARTATSRLFGIFGLEQHRASGEDFQASDDHLNDQIQQFFPEFWTQLMPLRARGLLSSSQEIQKVYAPYFLPVLERFYFYNPQNARIIAPYWNEHNFSPEQWNAVAGPAADFNVGGDLRKLNFGSRLSSLKIPVLVIAGRADGIVMPRLAERLRTCAPQAKFVMFEHSGHYPFIEEAPLFLKTVEEFLKR